jgi:organic hydroperoxide reductase OsmC/OhrA
MTGKTHSYETVVAWSHAEGTADYATYPRDHSLHIDGKPDIAMSADPTFRGDVTKHNPEELLVGSLSSCHMLWYLALCAMHGIVVVSYEDRAAGTLTEAEGGRFVEVHLHPIVKITVGDTEKARALHVTAHEKCFVANSVNFPVLVEPQIKTA